MSHWKNPIIDLGLIKAGSPVKLTFVALPNIPPIKEIKPYCGCTASKYDKDKGELSVTYSNRPIPNQVVGTQSITKRIDVKYEDGKVDVLTIKGNKIR